MNTGKASEAHKFFFFLKIFQMKFPQNSSDYQLNARWFQGILVYEMCERG